MFKPDSTFKKVALANHGSRACAYIYKDGVMLWEKRTAKSGKYETEIQVHHIYRCEVPIRSSDYGKQYDYTRDGMKCRRLVIHDARELLSGVDRVEVAYNNNSEHSREAGIKITSVIFYAPNGQRWEHDINEYLCSDVLPQPNTFGYYGSENDSPDSIEDVIKSCQDNYENYEIHEVKQ